LGQFLVEGARPSSSFFLFGFWFVSQLLTQTFEASKLLVALDFELRDYFNLLENLKLFGMLVEQLHPNGRFIVVFLKATVVPKTVSDHFDDEVVNLQGLLIQFQSGNVLRSVVHLGEGSPFVISKEVLVELSKHDLSLNFVELAFKFFLVSVLQQSYADFAC